tara:strand:- start:440 stop:664 length:225 start_codon:yes stop_codon:yes gene_type:complete
MTSRLQQQSSERCWKILYIIGSIKSGLLTTVTELQTTDPVGKHRLFEWTQLKGCGVKGRKVLAVEPVGTPYIHA